MIRDMGTVTNFRKSIAVSTFSGTRRQVLMESERGPSLNIDDVDDTSHAMKDCNSVRLPKNLKTCARDRTVQNF